MIIHKPSSGLPYAKSPNRKTQASIEKTITVFIPKRFKKNGILKMNNVSDIWEIDKMIVEYLTTKESGPYSGIFLKSSRNVSPYMFVNCNAAPKNIEKIKNKAILYFANNLKAFNPNCSMIDASFEIVL